MDVKDELEIRNLIARIGWLTDNWTSIDEYLKNYTEDAEWRIKGGAHHVGHEGIARRVQEMLDTGVCGPGLPARHSVTTLEVVADNEDRSRALVRSFGVMVTVENRNPVIISYGQKHDHVLKCADGRWRVTLREIEVLAWRDADAAP